MSSCMYPSVSADGRREGGSPGSLSDTESERKGTGRLLFSYAGYYNGLYRLRKLCGYLSGQTEGAGYEKTWHTEQNRGAELGICGEACVLQRRFGGRQDGKRFSV